MKVIIIKLGSIAIAYFLSAYNVFASEYFLPYPSFMPGHKLYRFSRMLDKLQGYWSFGSITKTKYHLNLADKYLVEAKILYEYKQYLLADDALRRSDENVQKISNFITNADNEGKDIQKFANTICNAMTVHKTILTILKQNLPQRFIWTPEKEQSRELAIAETLDNAIKIRNELQVLCE